MHSFKRIYELNKLKSKYNPKYLRVHQQIMNEIAYRFKCLTYTFGSKYESFFYKQNNTLYNNPFSKNMFHINKSYCYNLSQRLDLD